MMASHFRFRRVGAGFVVAVVLLVAGTGTSHAEDAEELIKQGVALRKRGEDLKAHGYFQRAYEIAHTPRSAAQLGLSDLALSKWLDAEVRLSEALAADDPWVETNRATLEKSRDNARSHLGKIEIDGAAPDTTVEVTGRPAGKLGADGVVWVNPGTAHLKLTATGYGPATQDVTVTEKGTAKARVTMARLEPEGGGTGTGTGSGDKGGGTVAGGGTEGGGTNDGGGGGALPPGGRDQGADKAASHRTMRIASLTVAGVGVAAAVTGVIFYVMAGNKIDAIKNDGTAGRPYNPDNGNYQTYDRLGLGMMIGGGVAAAAGVVGFVVNLDKPQPREPAKTVMLTPGPGEFGLAISGRY